jgi:hypothetical protein
MILAASPTNSWIECLMSHYLYLNIRRIFSAFGIIFLAFGLVSPTSVHAIGEAGDATTACDAATRQEERQNRIPARLLYAIATVESGRWDSETGASFAWPWTVTARGEGKFYPSREAAIRAVQALQREGVTNIDVGCMQINLGYHPDAFESLQNAFDPATNVAYAATFLNDLRKDKRSWSQAVRFYHSSDFERQTKYGDKVYTAWGEIRVRDRLAQLEKRRILAAERRARRVERNQVAVQEETEGNASARGIVWPPRDYRAQRQAEMTARAWAFSRN